MKTVGVGSKEFEKICSRHFNKKQRIASIVSKILQDVHLSGDRALIQYTRKFDKVNIPAKSIKVTEAEISIAFQNINPSF